MTATQPPRTGTITLVAEAVGAGGGTEDQVGRLARRLLEAGWAVRVVARSCAIEPHPRLVHVRVPGPARPALLAFPWFFVLGGVACAARARGLVHAVGPCVPNAAAVRTAHYSFAVYLARGGRVRAARAGVAHRLNGWAAERLGALAERWCYRPPRTGLLVTVSPGAARELVERFPGLTGRVRVVRNEVPRPADVADAEREALRSRAGACDGDRVAVFVGGDWERKGVTLAVDALAHAPGWRLLVVGDGDGASLERHAERAGVGDRVHVAGPRPDPGPYYAAADAFVLPTTYETFSLATYEAARARLPLVATPVSGVEDVLVDGRTGWAVERDAASIGAALRRLDDASARARMGEAAGTLAEAVAGDDLLEAHLRVYEEAAAR